MATRKRGARRRAAAPAPAEMNPMQEVWLAGLGALAIAQREGRRQFETLVKQGLAIEGQLRKLAAPQFERAAQTMMAAAEEMSDRARTTWEEMQRLMAGQVDKVMAGLGAANTPDVRALMRRVEETMSNVQSIAKWPAMWGAKPAASVPRPKARRKSVKRKATRRKTARRKTA